MKDLLAVRAWWTENVVIWVQAGQRGECPTTPARAYGWNDVVVVGGLALWSCVFLSRMPTAEEAP